MDVTRDSIAFRTVRARRRRATFHTIPRNGLAELRRSMHAFARDPLSSDYASYRQCFARLAQSAPTAHLDAVYGSFDFEGPRHCVRHAGGFSGRAEGDASAAALDAVGAGARSSKEQAV